MFKYLTTTRVIFFALALPFIFSSCDKDEPKPEPTTSTTPALRDKVEYSTLTSTTSYVNTFKDDNNDTTVDRREGQTRLRMIKAIDAYAKTASGTGTATLNATTFENMFANQGNAFTGIYADLNGSLLQVKNVTSASKSYAIAQEVRADFSQYFQEIATASASVANTASKGNAGKLGNYLVDARGIEVGQVLAKSLIGAFQLDYIGNLLLDKGLESENSYLVTGKNYTQLEHNWDEAYGVLTLNTIYASDGTHELKPTNEAFLGSYVWEYNSDNAGEGFAKIHPAFLKGRAAVVNNDRNEAKVQAEIIRRECEKAIINAAIGYLGKWKTAGSTDAARAHAIGEGAGFIYSIRFCKLSGGDEAFSDKVLADLGLYTGNGFWDLTTEKVNAAITAIDNKF
jgi:hypothetical protein